MKKQINSVSDLSVKSIITIIILGAMLCTVGAKANNKPSVSQNNATVEKTENEIVSRMNSNFESNYEAIEEYNAAEFVQADMAVEIASWMNNDDATNNDAVSEYNAAEFVRTDMALEIASWMNNNGI